MNKPLIPFEPVPVGPRHDGWTADKQIRFIEALVETGCVEEACRRVGMSDSAAYRLRQRPCGRAFRDAWDAALDCGMHRLEPAALSRAINGVARPIFHKGEQVGEWRHFDERLSMFLLRSRRPARYGKWIDRMLAPEPPDSNDHHRFQISCSKSASKHRSGRAIRSAATKTTRATTSSLKTWNDSRARVEQRT